MNIADYKHFSDKFISYDGDTLDLDYYVLKYNEEEGATIEPEWYIPILPLVLINGSEGIGTGFSTKIPSHNPSVSYTHLTLPTNREV